MTTNRVTLGRRGEQVAARHLQEEGLRILARNWRCAEGDVRGELDLVAWDGTTLVFCEVKARRNDRAGGPMAAVDGRKQARLRRLATAFLAESGLWAPELRFDVVGVRWPDGGRQPVVDHLRAVF